MSQKLDTSPAVIGIDIGKNSFHIVGQNQRGAIVLRQKWSRGQVEARLANLPPCRIGMEACVGAHHLSRTLKALGHDARLMPAKYVRPYSFGPHRYKANGLWYLSASPSKKSVQRFKTKIGNLLVPGNNDPWPEVRDTLNRSLLGWSNYFCHGTRRSAYRGVDRYVYERVRDFLARRHKVA